MYLQGIKINCFIPQTLAAIPKGFLSCQARDVCLKSVAASNDINTGAYTAAGKGQTWMLGKERTKVVLKLQQTAALSQRKLLVQHLSNAPASSTGMAMKCCIS